MSCLLDLPVPDVCALAVLLEVGVLYLESVKLGLGSVQPSFIIKIYEKNIYKTLTLKLEKNGEKIHIKSGMTVLC